MNTETLTQIGLTEIQAKIYLYLIRYGQSTPSEIAKRLEENRTTIYSALERLEKLGIITQKDKGKIAAYTPNHPSILEKLAERRLRSVARQAKNLEGSLPSLINYYNEHQHEPGATTFYGQEGIKMIYDKIIATGETFYFVRSQYDEKAVPEDLEKFKQDRIGADIEAVSITPSEFAEHTNETETKWHIKRTFLPPNEYSSSVEIDIFGDNVAFINYDKNGMSTLIESPEIADAMRQFFLFSKKYIRKATDQGELLNDIEKRIAS